MEEFKAIVLVDSFEATLLPVSVPALCHLSTPEPGSLDLEEKNDAPFLSSEKGSNDFN